MNPNATRYELVTFYSTSQHRVLIDRIASSSLQVGREETGTYLKLKLKLDGIE